MALPPLSSLPTGRGVRLQRAVMAWLGRGTPAGPEGGLKPDLWLSLKAPLCGPPSPLPHRALRIPAAGTLLLLSGFPGTWPAGGSPARGGSKEKGGGGGNRHLAEELRIPTPLANPPIPCRGPSAKAEDRGFRGRSPAHPAAAPVSLLPVPRSCGAARPRPRARVRPRSRRTRVSRPPSLPPARPPRRYSI